LISSGDTVGLKVYSAPGRNTGTHPALVEAVVRGLLEARIPPGQVIIWDKHAADLREAGFFEVAERFGIQIAASAAAGWDASQSYTNSVMGTLVWGDLEFGKKDESAGRRSFLSKLVTQKLTKIINLSPLLNHNFAGVAGNLYGLAIGSVDNTIRFELDVERLAVAVPEIYAMPALGDKVVLNIVDALVAQYEGGRRGLLHYSSVLNELRMSTDPVALDVLSLQDLNRLRTGNESGTTNKFELYDNAALLELGVRERRNMQIESPP
jgi:uncharacterized protein (DUF362 family)